MKTLCALVIAGCATTGSVPVSWPAIVQCTAPAEAKLLDKVVSILLAQGGDAQVIGESAVTELEQLAIANTPQTVICMVDLAVASLTPAAASSNALTSDALPAREPMLPQQPKQELASLAAAQRGRDFLRRSGTAIETAE